MDLRTSTRAVLVAVLVLVSSGAGVGPAADAATRAAARPSPVLGYVEGGAAPAVLRRNLPGLTRVGIDGVNITSSGASVSRPDADARAMLATAHRAGRPAELLVGNYNDAVGDFDPAVAHRLFASPANRRRVIDTLVSASRGWNGIQLDLESLHASDRAGLTRFTAELRAALPSNRTLSMAVMASTSTQGYRDAGYDLPALSTRLTRVVLMAYDQHGPTWSGPGPVGGLPWVKQSLTAMLRSVPRSKAVLGVAEYGYTWPRKGTGRTLGDAAARRAAGRSAVWDPTQAEWRGRLARGGTIWWSDARSLRVRRELARRAGVQGVAVWSLGLGDTIPR